MTMKRKILAAALVLTLAGASSFVPVNPDPCDLLLEKCENDWCSEVVYVQQGDYEQIQELIADGYVVIGTECDTPTPPRKRKPRRKNPL
jgi:hypothetical protein